MRKILPILFLLILVIPKNVLASELAVSKSSSFSSSDLNFNAGQTVYVRLNTDSSGANQALNLRDNNYNLIASYSLSKNGNNYTGSFGAPGSDGYYSVEAHIWGSGSDVTSVKTIKVGSANGGSVNVHVNSNVNGSSSTSQSQSGKSKSEGTDESGGSNGSDDKTSPMPSASPAASPTPQVYGEKTEVKPTGSFSWFWMVVKTAVFFMWPL